MYPHLKCAKPGCTEVAEPISSYCAFHAPDRAAEIIEGIVDRALPYGIKVVRRDGVELLFPATAQDARAGVPFSRSPLANFIRGALGL